MPVVSSMKRSEEESCSVRQFKGTVYTRLIENDDLA